MTGKSATIVLSDVFDELRDERDALQRRLSSTLVLAERLKAMLDKYRNYLSLYVRDCGCGQRVAANTVLADLEGEYSAVVDSDGQRGAKSERLFDEHNGLNSCDETAKSKAIAVCDRNVGKRKAFRGRQNIEPKIMIRNKKKLKAYERCADRDSKDSRVPSNTGASDCVDKANNAANNNGFIFGSNLIRGKSSVGCDPIVEPMVVNECLLNIDDESTITIAESEEQVNHAQIKVTYNNYKSTNKWQRRRKPDKQSLLKDDPFSFRCRYKNCRKEFKTNFALKKHIEEHTSRTLKFIPTEKRKSFHNDMERQRRQQLRRDFCILEKQLPKEDKRKSNIKLLNSAIDYINLLTDQQKHFESELLAEQQKRDKLVQIWTEVTVVNSV